VTDSRDKFADIFEPGDSDRRMKANRLELGSLAEGSGVGGKLSECCMDLMMYKSPELFEASFSLLLASFNQRPPVIEALQSVIVVPDGKLFDEKLFDEKPLVVRWPQVNGGYEEAKVQTVEELERCRQVLSRGCEAYELWAIDDEQEGQDLRGFRQVLGHIILFIKFPMRKSLQGGTSKEPKAMIEGEKVIPIPDFFTDFVGGFDFQYEVQGQEVLEEKEEEKEGSFAEDLTIYTLNQNLLRGDRSAYCSAESRGRYSFS
jgi:hypothetical protein